ncbi:conserved hypothetical protein [Ricinus communis]|uniref:RRM domain-containing protein n=2 Tax=Ricinus communis TaxID=3988 RepID=B9RRA8_RICCO|nr:conserved hypothetical protein [Ricinus communis]
MEDFKLFHSIDRELYTVLVMNLWRDPMESMQVMALWLWLERVGYSHLVKKILSLPNILINDLADETIICLSCLTSDQFACQSNDIPLLQSLMEKEISVKHFHDSRVDATQGVVKITNEVCVRACDDIMQRAIERNNKHNLPDNQKGILPTIPQSELLDQIKFTPKDHKILPYTQKSSGVPPKDRKNLQDKQKGILPTITQPKLLNKIEFTPQAHKKRTYTQKNIGGPPEDRTLFVTFSRGYPVHEWEVREFLARSYGDCIESLHMQGGMGLHKQALFARIVFHSAKTIQAILNGMDKAKFNINGKHVWARKFVPKPQKPSLPSVSLLPNNLLSLYINQAMSG